MAEKGVQVLASLRQEDFDELISTCCENERLVVRWDAVCAFFWQLFGRLYPELLRELVLEELRTHQKGASLSFDQQNSLNHILMCEKSEDWGFFVDVPNYNALVVRSTDEGLPIFGYAKRPHPFFMSFEGLFAVSCLHIP